MFAVIVIARFITDFGVSRPYNHAMNGNSKGLTLALMEFAIAVT